MTTAHDRVSDMLAKWHSLRIEIAELERAEHPDIADTEGRTWKWWKGDLYRHESKAWPRAFIRTDHEGLTP